MQKSSIRTFRRALPCLAAALLAASIDTAGAGDLFTLSGNTIDGGPVVGFNQGSSKLPSFVQDLVTGSGQFSGLANRGLQAGLRYADVPNALNFNIQQVGTLWTARLVSPFDPGIINRTFTAATRDQLDDAIQAYLKKDGSADLAKFLAAMGKRSVAGVLDGNPNAATAQVANQTFMEYGFRPTETADEIAADEDGDAAAPASHVGLAMTADVGTFRSRGIEGQSYSWTPVLPIVVGKARRVKVELALPVNYTQIEGADQYRAGAQVGVSVLVVKRRKDQPWLWQVSTHAGAVVAGSADLVAGGLMASGGVTSYTSYRQGNWEFSMGNQVSVHEGIRVSVDSYTFDPEVSQQIIKNGLKVGRSLGRRWYAEAYVIDTEFAQAAFTSRFTTVGAGVGYRGANRKGYVMVGSYAEFGPNYESAHFQFGTGWKF